MNQTFRIFRKDVCALAPFLLTLLALHAVFAVSTIRTVGIVDTLDNRLEAIVGITEALLFLAWIFVLALVIQQDPPVGENSFWLTRPYSWLAVLAAKVIFAAVFLNLTLLLSDLLILHSVGLHIDFFHLMLRQLPLFALVIVPAFALACISRSIAQFSLFLVLAILVMIVEMMATAKPYRESFDSFIKLPDTVILSLLPLCALPSIVIQFGKRVFWTRVAIPVVVVVLMPFIFLTCLVKEDDMVFSAELRVAQHNPNWSQVHLRLERPKPKNEDDFAGRLAWMGLEIPVIIDGLPPGLVLRGQGQTRIGGFTKPFPSSLFQQVDGSYVILLKEFYTRMPSHIDVPVQTSLDLWVLNDKPTFSTHLSRTNPVNIPNVGICNSGPSVNTITCWQGPAVNPDLKILAKGKVKVFGQESSRDSDSDRMVQLIWDFSPIEKKARDMDTDVPIAFSHDVSFAPRIPVGTFHTNLSDTSYPLSDCTPEFRFSIDKDTPH